MICASPNQGVMFSISLRLIGAALDYLGPGTGSVESSQTALQGSDWGGTGWREGSVPSFGSGPGGRRAVVIQSVILIMTERHTLRVPRAFLTYDRISTHRRAKRALIQNEAITCRDTEKAGTVSFPVLTIQLWKVSKVIPDGRYLTFSTVHR